MTRMKDSGIEWIGEVPEDWEIVRLGSVFFERNSKVSSEDYGPLSVTKNGIVTQLEDVAKSNKTSDRKKVLKGDFVINSRSDRKQSCGLSNLKGSVSLINIVLELGNISKGYTKYLLDNYMFAEEFYRWGTGIVDDLWSTRYEKMKRIQLPLPPKDQQKKIANFLDQKVGEIDRVIEKTKEVIEDYKSYKQSLITETITKGLRKDVDLKDSGIEWIGEIPEHWKVTRLKRTLSIPITDGPHETPLLLDEGVPFISAEAIKNNKINFNHKRGFISIVDHKKYIRKSNPKKNDILMVKSGATTGRLAKVTIEKEFSIWSPLALIRSGSELYYNYLFYYLLSDIYQKQIVLFWNYGTQQNIGMGVIGNLYISFPPLDEQKEIADYLDEKCGYIDRIIETKEGLIKELEAYKKSLIYETVTGKREVD